MLTAAKAMRQTGKPVGLLMWRGRHAWVMSGFRATGDPLAPGTRVTAVYVEDPLYPHGSSVWGPSPAPGAALTVESWVASTSRGARRTGLGSALSGKYVLVLPFAIDREDVSAGLARASQPRRDQAATRRAEQRHRLRELGQRLRDARLEHHDDVVGAGGRVRGEARGDLGGRSAHAPGCDGSKVGHIRSG